MKGMLTSKIVQRKKALHSYVDIVDIFVFNGQKDKFLFIFIRLFCFTNLKFDSIQHYCYPHKVKLLTHFVDLKESITT